MKLPIGISDFQKLIKGEYQFADKSNLIKDIINDSAEVSLITRPRRFGKTLNLSMLYYFFSSSESHNLFENLEISKDVEFCQKHQHQYPVIFISFKDVKQSSFESASSFVTMLISNLYKNHRYLLNDNMLLDDEKKLFNDIINEQANPRHIATSLLQLSGYLERKFGKKAIILIDEYDTPIQAAYLSDYYQSMMELMRGILGSALKDNQSFSKAVITGITRIAQESLFSDLNNLEVYSLLREEYGQYFGFTEKEVVALINETNTNIDPSLFDL